jgi:hypothetical protein
VPCVAIREARVPTNASFAFRSVLEAFVLRPNATIDLSIDLSPVSHVHNEDRKIRIADLVDHSVVTDSDAPCLPAGEFLDTGRTRARREPANGGNDTVLEDGRE